MLRREPGTVIALEFRIADVCRDLLRDEFALRRSPMGRSGAEVEPSERRVPFLVGDDVIEHRSDCRIFCVGAPGAAELELQSVLECGKTRNITVEMLPGIEHAAMQISIERRFIAAIGRPGQTAAECFRDAFETFDVPRLFGVAHREKKLRIDFAAGLHAEADQEGRGLGQAGDLHPQPSAPRPPRRFAGWCIVLLGAQFGPVDVAMRIPAAGFAGVVKLPDLRKRDIHFQRKAPFDQKTKRRQRRRRPWCGAVHLRWCRASDA